MILNSPGNLASIQAAYRFQAASKSNCSLVFGVLLGTLSGCMWFLACPPHPFFFLAWFAMLPVLFVLDRARNWRQAALVSWLAGAVTTGGGFYWIDQLLVRFAGMPRIAALSLFLAFCLYQGITCLLFGLIVYKVLRGTILPMTLLAPVVMVTCELLVPWLFPCNLAITQAFHPLLIQTADLAGPLGVTALLFLLNGMIHDLLWQRSKSRRAVALGALIIASALTYGFLRMRHFDHVSARAHQLTVGIVQPNVPYNRKGVSHRDLAQAQLRDLQEQSRQLEFSGAQLIVWSEGSYPFTLRQDLTRDFAQADPRQLQRGFSTAVATGAITYDPTNRALYNSAVLVDAHGAITGRYDKMELVPFGEGLPRWLDFRAVRKMIPPGFGKLRAGQTFRALPFQSADGRTYPLGVIICYEDIMPQLLRKAGAQHPYLLINPTNDAWFGAKTEPLEHLALAMFGTVEQRTGMIRAVNSGVSAFIDPSGRLVAKIDAVDPILDSHPPTSLLVKVPLLASGTTVFAKVGNAFAYVCAAFTAILLVHAFRRQRAPEKSAPGNRSPRTRSRGRNSGTHGRSFGVGK